LVSSNDSYSIDNNILGILLAEIYRIILYCFYYRVWKFDRPSQR
jgi:hypothetical protein